MNSSGADPITTGGQRSGPVTTCHRLWSEVESLTEAIRSVQALPGSRTDGAKELMAATLNHRCVLFGRFMPIHADGVFLLRTETVVSATGPQCSHARCFSGSLHNCSRGAVKREKVRSNSRPCNAKLSRCRED